MPSMDFDTLLCIRFLPQHTLYPTLYGLGQSNVYILTHPYTSRRLVPNAQVGEPRGATGTEVRRI